MSEYQRLQLPDNGGGVLLPFKPYTYAEVHAITKLPVFQIDSVVESGILGEPKVGDDGITQGLDHTQCFALFCAAKWQEEGAPDDKINKLIIFLVHSNYSVIMQEIQAGRSFPACGLPEGEVPGGVLLVEPPKNRMGHALNLNTLRYAFFDALERTFPKKTTVKTT